MATVVKYNGGGSSEGLYVWKVYDVSYVAGYGLNSDMYPDNDWLNDEFYSKYTDETMFIWIQYELDHSTTPASKGARTGLQVASIDQNAYPQDGEQDGYWYTFDDEYMNYTVWRKLTFINYTTSDYEDDYPHMAIQDNQYYERIPTRYVSVDEPGVSVGIENDIWIKLDQEVGA